MQPFKRYYQRYRGRLIRLWVEEFAGWLTRSLPGIMGMTVRWILYRTLFEKIDSFAFIYPGVYLTHSYGIRVGKNFSINTGAHLDGRGGIIIGKDVMIGPYVVIVSSHHQHRQINASMTSLDHITNPVTIHDDVWIGAHAVIRDGVVIERGVVIAAGAVVVNDVAEYQMVAGVPAKVVSDRRSSSDTIISSSKIGSSEYLNADQPGEN